MMLVRQCRLAPLSALKMTILTLLLVLQLLLLMCVALRCVLLNRLSATMSKTIPSISPALICLYWSAVLLLLYVMLVLPRPMVKCMFALKLILLSLMAWLVALKLLQMALILLKFRICVGLMVPWMLIASVK
nr:MAG TPA: hypothetical protein [Caudoviricetes sp.]